LASDGDGRAGRAEAPPPAQRPDSRRPTKPRAPLIARDPTHFRSPAPKLYFTAIKLVDQGALPARADTIGEHASMTRTSRYLTCAGYEIHFSEWGTANDQAVVMWHGLARTGRDFDDIAGHLAARYSVICPDTIGRGLSEWAKDRERDYCFAVYCDIALALLDQLGVDRLRWVGTSMGGLIGVTLAAEALKGRVTHLVINDIGPEVPQAAAERIATYAGNPPSFPTFGEFEAWIRTIYLPFGEHDDATWKLLAETGHRRTDDGLITVHYDPRIVTQFTTHKSDLDLWEAYDAVTCPTLLLRGADSDVLPAAVAEAMTQRGPKAEVVVIEGVGHAPLLDNAEQRALVADFLAR
jgi:pimeloyl-ACP methyl ester carboxylesterase